MFDSSATQEDALDPDQVAEFSSELSSLHVEHAWLVDHHPFWGVASSAKGKGVKPLSAPLEAAWENAKPAGVDMVLSGHVHMFAVIPFDVDRPLQIVSGDGGTALAGPIPESIDGTLIRGNAVRGSQIRVEFGYALLRKSTATPSEAWDLTLRSTQDEAIVRCSIAAGHSACGSNEK
jgi:hypothetical protein